MPGKARVGKIRSASGAKKRFRKTGSGKFVSQKAGHNHLLQQKSRRQKRLSRKAFVNSSIDKRALSRVLPNL
ncbi:50S ribosomal protein L35 [Candidatus Peregrinibacteria bacterium]|nr:50S ribosomal protein L35 [Candidatus Peregrinibacteria bacterium]